MAAANTTHDMRPVHMQRLELEPGQPLLYTWAGLGGAFGGWSDSDGNSVGNHGEMLENFGNAGKICWNHGKNDDCQTRFVKTS